MIKFAYATDELIRSCQTKGIDMIDTTEIKTYVSMNSAKKHLLKDAKLYDRVSEIWKLAINEDKHGKLLERIRLVKGK